MHEWEEHMRGWNMGVTAYLMGIVGIILGIMMIVAAIMLYANPKQHELWGALIIVFSVASVISCMGGMGIGLILGIIGGILAVLWRPEETKQTQRNYGSVICNANISHCGCVYSNVSLHSVTVFSSFSWFSTGKEVEEKSFESISGGLNRKRGRLWVVVCFGLVDASARLGRGQRARLCRYGVSGASAALPCYYVERCRACYPIH